MTDPWAPLALGRKLRIPPTAQAGWAPSCVWGREVALLGSPGRPGCCSSAEGEGVTGVGFLLSTGPEAP